jgi:hypothetical protein
MPNKLHLQTVSCSAISLATVLLLWFYAAGGAVAYTMDSLTYRDAALNFLAGRPWMATNVISETPMYISMAVWPPGYSSLWAITSFAFGLDIDAVPRILVPILLGITTLCLFWIVMMMIGKPIIAGVVATLHAFTPTSMAVFGHAWSETLSLPLCLLSFAALWKYATAPDNGSRMRWLAITAFFIVLANWTRYSAVVLLPLMGLTVLLMPRLSLTIRLAHICFASFLSLVCIVPLWLRNFQMTGSISGSDRGGAPRFVVDRLMGDLHAVLEMLEMGVFSFNVLLRANLEVPLLLLSIFLLVRALRTKGLHILVHQSVWMPLLWAFGMLAFLLLARSLQTQLDMDYRMLSMTTPFLVLALVSPLQAAIPLSSQRRFQGAWAMAVLGSMIYTGVSEAQRVRNNTDTGRAPAWRANFAIVYRDLSDASRYTRAIKAALAGIPASTLILTDYRGLYIRYLTSTKAYQVNNLAECTKWASANTTGVLLTGYSNPIFSQLPEGRWARECVAANPAWKVIQIIGQGSHSMFAEE